MKKIINLIAKDALWCIMAVFAIIGLAFSPSFTSLFALLFAVIIAPVSRLQCIVNRVLQTRKRKIIALVVLFILTFSFVPSAEETGEQSEPVAQVVATEEPAVELLKEIPFHTPEILEVAEKPLPIDSKFEIHFLDVGQADSMLVLCDDHTMLVDGGDPDDSSFIYSYLKDKGIEHLDIIIGTHAHSDHVGGLAGALNYATVGTAYAPVNESENSAFVSFVEYLDKQNVSITVPAAGDSFELGNSVVTVLGPIDLSEEPNNTSIVIRIEYGETSFILTGDAEESEEVDILSSGYTLESTVLKVGHHGSSSSTSEAFLNAVNPEYAVVSDGVDASGFGRLTEKTLGKLQAADIEVYRTDLQGNIICTSDGKTVSFSVEKNIDVDTSAIMPLVLETPTPETTESQVTKDIPSPEPTPEGRTYILNTNSRKFHYPSCSSVGKMKESNKAEFFGTRDEIMSIGYDPCGSCHP